MEFQIFDEISKRVKSGEKAALISLIKKTGVSPGKPGMMMVVFEDGSTLGTIGGGNLEYKAVQEGISCIEREESVHKSFESEKKSASDNKCASGAEVFIKIFVPKNEILIVGCGHVGTNFYKVARTQSFKISLFDDREGFCTDEKFPDGDIYFGNVPENLKKYNIGKNTYIMVCRHSHDADQEALEAVLQRDAAYVGMLGSKNKVKSIRANLLEKGFPESEIDKLYAPVGIDVGSNSPEELSIGVMAQMLMVKNKKE